MRAGQVPKQLALIGHGWWAADHLMRGLSGNPDIEVVALCGRDRRRAEAAALKMGVARAYVNLQDLLDTEQELAGILIATPPDSHRLVVEPAATRGLAIYCEKPLALNSADSEYMLSASLGVETMTGFTLRWVTGLRRLRDMVRSGAIGDVHACRIQYLLSSNADPDTPWNWHHDVTQEPLGVVGDLGPHAIDLLRWIFGEIESVSARGEIVFDARPHEALPARKTQDKRPVTNMDCAELLLHLSSGIDATVSLSRVAMPQVGDYRIRLTAVGSRGSVSFSMNRPDSLVFRVNGRGSGTRVGNASPSPGLDDYFRRLAPRQMGDFGDLACGSRPIRDDLPTFRDGHRAQEVIDATAKAVGTGEWHRVRS